MGPISGPLHTVTPYFKHRTIKHLAMDIKIEKLAAMRRPECKLTIPNIDPLTATVSGKMQNTR